MPLIDLRCKSCDVISEANRPIAEWPAVPACPACDSSDTEQIMLPPAARWQADAVVVFRAPDGTYRYPGDSNGLSAAAYAAQGYQRLELRNFADVRHFERDANAKEASIIARRVEQQLEMRERGEGLRRSELHHLVRSMSPFGRAFAETAMRRNDAKPKPKAGDAGIRIEAYSEDRSNREESRDAHGRRRRD